MIKEISTENPRNSRREWRGQDLNASRLAPQLIRLTRILNSQEISCLTWTQLPNPKQQESSCPLGEAPISRDIPSAQKQPPSVLFVGAAMLTLSSGALSRRTFSDESRFICAVHLLHVITECLNMADVRNRLSLLS